MTEWHSAAPAPVVLLQGPEDILVERARDRIRGQVVAADPSTEITQLEGTGYRRSLLAEVTAPSLFMEPRLVLLDHLEAGDQLLLEDLKAYVGDPADGTVLVLMHRGGNRGKAFVDLLKKADVPIVDCPAIKKPQDRMAFAAGEFQRAGRQADSRAVAALADAFGSDLSGLSGLVRQLVVDTTPDPGEEAPRITVDTVHAFTAGRVETKSFTVADAAIAGDRAGALTALQQCLDTGVDPVPLVAALASKVRTTAKVSALGHDGVTARTLGMPDWMLRRAQKEARAWSQRGLAVAIETVARADAAVKGGSRDAEWAAQRAVLQLCEARRLR